MSRARRFVLACVDPLIGLGLAVGYVWLLLRTSHDLGYARDEGFYFQAARSYQGWFQILFDSPKAAFERATIDRYWVANNEHPALVKSLFALSHHFLHTKWKLIAEEGTSFRFPGMVLSGVTVAVTYLWGRRVSGRLAGLVAALSLAMMPRVFYHSHLDCFDMPVAAMWLLTTYAYWRSISGGGWLWAIATGVLYGLLLDTKHNSWLLPPALIVHFVLARGGGFWRELRTGRVRAPLALIAMAVIGPAVFYALWPWIWHDTGKRLAAYVAFHTGHEYYNMEFLGRTYWKPPMPLGYAWVMTVATVPAITLLLFVIGLGDATKRGLVVRLGAWQRAVAKRLGRPEAGASSPADRELFSTELLWLGCILTSYAPWISKSTPIFGGTKHWITAYPFMALFAAQGFVLVSRALSSFLAERRRLARAAAQLGLAASAVAAPIAIAIGSHPWGLGAYTPLVGGAPGAASLGLNRSFWGYTTGSVQGFLNERAPPNASVYVHDTAMQSWDQMVRDGRLRADLRAAWSPAGSSFALYHHEPHMLRVEYQLWVDYGTIAPAHVGAYDGVPVVWVYERPKR
jgi:4-amino-4-deoxy-L-arabinose transferase-like glycosyltransferase